ncbi:PREDICTED: uncharacterized protein LOC108362231 [Rhagoletis zephyria]|uniref:uncharacterized protein LOC108362231 n=1 Tax=Rhagoletis zephyria TaxID=28612 RepID=UPI00081158EC|nr:PREDICTED: uncharacterized protein LOC108362231 [Rhagoletis zephyria]
MKTVCDMYVRNDLQFVNIVPPLEKVEDSRSRLSAQRRIEFDSKLGAKAEDYYDSYDADLIVTIANTPLSPISSEIASPIEINNKFRDHKPATEIDGCGVGITYMLKEIDIPKVVVNKPDDLDLLLRTNTTDPRLLRYLKKNTNALHASSSLCLSTKIAQSDPRRPSSIYNSESYLNQRPQEPSQQTPNMLLYGCLQRSPWYQSLMSTMKIQINQTISVLVRAINNFQKIRLEDPYAVFDIFKLYCAGELLEILENLGLFVDVNGVISEKKNLSTFSGRSYGCSSVVNATYSFIQPVEPSSVTVQHQQMRSFTSPRSNFATPPALQQPAPAPFISCYIDSPQMTMDKPVQMTQPPTPRPPPKHSRAAPFPPSVPRRHCGLKVPYTCSTPPARSSVSPVKKQARCPDTDEECWDLDEDINSFTPSKLPLSPDSGNDYEQPHINYSRPERNDEGRSSNYGKSFGSHKKRYK